MRDYSVSGDFGQIKKFDVCISSERFSSLDRISAIGWHRVNDLYRIDRPEGCSSGLLLLTLSGRGEVKIHNTRYTLLPGSLAIIPVGCAHTYGTACGGEWEFYWLHFCGSNAVACTRDIVCGSTYVFDIGVQGLHALFASYLDNKTIGVERELDNAEWLGRILHLLLRKSVLPQDICNEKGVAEDMMRFLENDTGTHFSLDALVSTYHYSKEYLIRLFKRAMGMTPYRYWLLLKLKRSCLALEKENKSIEQIAKECGYRAVSNYSNQFKKYYRMSPTEYRRLYRFGQNEPSFGGN